MADAYTLKAILSAVDKLSPVLKVVQAQSQVARKYIGDLGGAVNGLATKFGVGAGIFAGLAAGFGIGAIKKAVVGYAELGEEVIKGAAKAGMSSDQFQRFKYVAEQAGVQADMFAMSMGKLEKNLGSAAMGKNQGLVDLMKMLKIPLTGVNGEVREAVDVLPQLAQAIALNEAGVKRAAIGNAFLGKSYQELLPMLAEGSEGIERSLARFKQLKGVIPREDLEGAKEFGDKLQDLAFVTKGFQMTVARELVPVLSPLVESFVQWAAANKKLVGAEVKRIVQDLVAVVKQVDWAKFVDGVRSTISGVGRFVDAVGGMRNVLIGLALYMNASTIASIIGIAGAFGRLGIAAVGALLPAAAAAWPFLLAAAAIAGAAYLVWRNWDVVGPALSGVWDRIQTTATIAWNALRFLWSWSPLGIVVNNWGAITGWLSVFWQNLVGVVTAGVDLVMGLLRNWGVLEVLQAVWNPIVEFFKGIWNAIGAIVGPIVGAAVKVGSALFGAGQAVGGQLADTFGPGATNTAFGPRIDGPGTALATAPVNLNAASQATLNGKVDISFKDAPPGMRVEQSKADGGRVALNTNVGYRYTAAMGY